MTSPNDFSYSITSHTCQSAGKELEDFSGYLYSTDHTYKLALRIYFLEYATKVAKGYAPVDADQYAMEVVENMFDLEVLHDENSEWYQGVTERDMFQDLKGVFFNERGHQFKMELYGLNVENQWVTIYHNPAQGDSRYASVK